jgi:hypothetical protein
MLPGTRDSTAARSSATPVAEAASDEPTRPPTALASEALSLPLLSNRAARPPSSRSSRCARLAFPQAAKPFTSPLPAMERPSLERYREILAEEGVDVPEEELRALHEQIGLLAEVIVDLYLDLGAGRFGTGLDTVERRPNPKQMSQRTTRRRG